MEDHGYAKVAALMTKHDEFTIFRRFKKLNCLNLLYLQAEIMELEDSLETLSAMHGSETHRKQFASDWQYLSQKQGPDNKHHEQWEKVLQLRQRLSEYNDTLLKQALLTAHLKRPNALDIQSLRDWLERPDMGNFPIVSIDRLAWEPEFKDDLAAFTARAPDDPTSRWFVNTALPLFHRVYGRRFKTPNSPELGELCTYKESHLKKVADLLVTVVAALLPLMSTVTLFLLKTDGQKLGVLVAFSACFATALALMTNARKIEVFSATAAFAAVNVVFLSIQPPSSPPSTKSG